MAVVLLCAPSCVVFAEAESQEQSMTEYFRENWLDKLLTAASVLAGVVGAVALAAYKTTKVLATCKETVREVGEKKDALTTYEELLQENLEKQKELVFVGKELYEACERLQEEAKTSSSEQSAQIERIKKMLYIFATNSQEMVRKGYAQTIVEAAAYERE